MFSSMGIIVVISNLVVVSSGCFSVVLSNSVVAFRVVVCCWFVFDEIASLLAGNVKQNSISYRERFIIKGG